MEPGTISEKQITVIWQDVLKIEKISIEDNFFELGGHSLLAMKVMSCIRDQLGKEIPLSSMFKSPTVKGLALALDEIPDDKTSEEDVESILAELEAISNEEAIELLAVEKNKGDHSNG